MPGSPEGIMNSSMTMRGAASFASGFMWAHPVVNATVAARASNGFFISSSRDEFAQLRGKLLERRLVHVHHVPGLVVGDAEVVAHLRREAEMRHRIVGAE